MKIGCLMVTEGRAAVAGIGISSFSCQRLTPKLEAVLLVQDNHSDLTGYGSVIDRVEHVAEVIYHSVDFPTGPEYISAQIDVGCKELFETRGCDMVAFWDDDDYSPPERLALTAAGSNLPVCGYTAGWFVNLRTLRGEFVNASEWGLWGGSIAFTKAAWQNVPFTGLPCRSYDREFVARCNMIHTFRSEPDGRDLPIAFSHGKNITTWLKTKGVNMLQNNIFEKLPELVYREVRLAQRFLIERRVFPPQPE